MHALAVFSFFSVLLYFYACRNNYRKSDRERVRGYTNIKKSGQESTSILFSVTRLLSLFVFLDCHTAGSKSSQSGQRTTTIHTHTHTERDRQRRTNKDKGKNGEDKCQATLLNPLAPHLAGLTPLAHFSFLFTSQPVRPFFLLWTITWTILSQSTFFFFTP